MHSYIHIILSKVGVMKVHLSKYYIGGKQKRPNKGPFFVTHGIERVKRGGGKGHIYFRGCGSSILRTYYDVLPTKSVTYYYTFPPIKATSKVINIKWTIT